jgi:hypothetical protein
MSWYHLMRKPGWSLVIIVSVALTETVLKAEPPVKRERKSNSIESARTTKPEPSQARLIESANGWIYVKGEWMHPDGYKFANNKILRTTAKAGKAFPKPPGKLALENPTKLMPRNKSADRRSSPEAQTAAEKAAEARRKNLTPTPASQTGTHL